MERSSKLEKGCSSFFEIILYKFFKVGMHPYFIVIKLIGDFENDVLNDICIRNHNVGIIRSKNYNKKIEQRGSPFNINY